MSQSTASDRVLEEPHGVPRAAIDELDVRLRGPVLLPEERGYESARRVFNAMIDRRPALIIRCVTAQDVIEGVKFAGEHNLPLSVKGGGHGVAGNAVCDDGLMLDLSLMKRVEIDPTGPLATVQPGLTLGDLDRATQRFGLATPSGVVSMTGLSGLALGGGLGWLNGKHGLTCDNLLAAEVVTATGELISVSAEQNQDLFWALQGGGGNFGVVTSFSFGLHPVEHVLAGAFTYPAGKARAALRLYRDFAGLCPDELTANGSVAMSPDGDVAVSIAVCYAGSFARGEELLAPLRRLGPEVDAVAPMSYLALQKAPDEGFPSGQQHYWKSAYLTDLSDEVIDVMLDFGARMPSNSSGVGLQRLHGAAGRVQPTATAFPHRGDRYDCLILSQWPDPAQSDQNIEWTRELFAAIRPYFAGGVYVNNLGADEAERVGQAYGPNHGRLAGVKAAYDPANRFRHNHNIKPATGVTAPA